jgi:hypothetical protein
LDLHFVDGLEWHGCVRPPPSSLPAQAPYTAASLIHFCLRVLFSFPSPRRRGAHHASALLSLIDRFPRKNLRPDDEGVDMSAQLRLIRSRYKAMCASLGVRARLQPAPPPPPTVGSEAGPGTSGSEGARYLDADADAEKRRQRQKTIWPLTAPPASPSTQGLSF